MTNQVIQDLMTRYTTKQYDSSKKIPQQDLDVIYEALRLTPSSINSQPWKFIVIESDAAKQRLAATYAKKHQFNQHHITEASHIIMLAYNPTYTREDYAHTIDVDIANGRTPAEMKQGFLDMAFGFVEMYTDPHGRNEGWTKAQLYIALGNLLSTLPRLGIDGTPMEGVDIDLIAEEFKQELGGYQCDVIVAMGYHKAGAKEDGQPYDYNKELIKSRLPLEEVVYVL